MKISAKFLNPQTKVKTKAINPKTRQKTQQILTKMLHISTENTLYTNQKSNAHKLWE